MWKVCVDWILGVRAEIRGLLVDPCIPPEWDSYSVTRRFRKATYQIDVQNPEHVSRGIKEVWVDGGQYHSHVLPVFEAGSQHQIKVIMGSPTGAVIEQEPVGAKSES
jgi:cellobiose phosphorylase